MPTTGETTCERCGSVYSVTATKITQRDSDFLNCAVCGEELLRWNEANIFSAKLTRPGVWPRPASN